MTPTKLDLARAKKLISWDCIDPIEGKKMADAIAQALVDERERAIRAANNASCNAHARYTCCLENGLNAKNIIVVAIQKAGEF